MTYRGIKRSKSPRLTWEWPPQYPNGVLKPGFREYLDDISVCQSLVEIFNELVDLDLKLKWNNNKEGVEAFITEDGTINVPKMHPNRRILVKHEISHPAFGSCFTKLKAFLNYMVERLDPNGTLTEREKLAIRSECSLIHNIFEDVRVDSCWAKVFPGDGRDLEDWHENEIGPEILYKSRKTYKNGNIKSLGLFICLVVLKQPARSTKWEKYKSRILKCAEDVKLVNFDTCIIYIKDLIFDLLTDQLKTKKPNNSQQGTSGQGGKSGKPKSGKGQASSNGQNNIDKDKVKDFINNSTDVTDPLSQNAGFIYHKHCTDGSVDKKVQKSIDNILDSNDKQKEEIKAKGMQEIKAKVEEAINKNIGELTSVNGFITNANKMHALESKFNVRKITSGNAIEITPEMRTHIKKFSSEFARIKGKRKRRLEYGGSKLHMTNVLKNYISRTNLPYYQHLSKQRGYELVVILDCSGSMWSSINDLEKLFITIKESIKDIKEVKLSVFGFQQNDDGFTDIFIWQNSKYLFGGELNLGGTTPMPQAIHYVKKLITKTDNKKSVLVIGDGHPVFTSMDNGNIETKNLMWWVRREVEDLLKLGIRTYGLMIGSSLPDDEEMTRMFISKENWVKLSRDKLLPETLKYINKEFMKELK